MESLSASKVGSLDLEVGLPRPPGKTSGGGSLTAAADAARHTHPHRLVVVFQHVTFEIRQGRRKPWQPLLRDVSGFICPTQLTAIIGPLGSGKTTLLDLLAGRKTSGRLAPCSEILFNGRAPSSALLRRDGGCPAASSGSFHPLPLCLICIRPAPPPAAHLHSSARSPSAPAPLNVRVCLCVCSGVRGAAQHPAAAAHPF